MTTFVIYAPHIPSYQRIVRKPSRTFPPILSSLKKICVSILKFAFPVKLFARNMHKLCNLIRHFLTFLENNKNIIFFIIKPFNVGRIRKLNDPVKIASVAFIIYFSRSAQFKLNLLKKLTVRIVCYTCRGVF